MYAKAIDSTRSTCSLCGLPQTPKYVGRGVTESIIVEILPAEERKSMNLLCFGTSDFSSWLLCSPFEFG